MYDLQGEAFPAIMRLPFRNVKMRTVPSSEPKLGEQKTRGPM